MDGPLEESERRASETADLLEEETHPWVGLVWKVLLAWIAHLGLVAMIVVLVYGAAAPFFDWLDEATLRWLYGAYGPEGAAWAGRVSLLGQPYVAVPLLVSALLVVFAYASLREAFFVFAVYFFAGADYLVLVQLFGRARPHLFEQLPEPTGFGTPSGHATATMALFCGAALVAWRHHGRRSAPFVAICVLVFVAVGLSRVYLQVHFPTDVALAWIVTGTWMWIAHALMFQRVVRDRGGARARSPSGRGRRRRGAR